MRSVPLTSRGSATLLGLMVILGGIVVLTLLPYNWQPSALFHADQSIGATHPPSPFVTLTVPAYDGMQYYQAARNLPLFATRQWQALKKTTIPGPYAYQRILLPVTAFILAGGQDGWLPWSFLIVNLGALLLAAALILKWENGSPVDAIALALCPAAMLGLHFSLAEPLNLFLLVWFLIRFDDDEHLTFVDSVLLSLVVLTREVNILFVGALLLILLFKRRWRDLPFLLPPIAVFAGWQFALFTLFGTVPFFMSTDKSSLPFVGIVHVLQNATTGLYPLSSALLFVGFVLPALVIALYRIIREKTADTVTLLLLFFLLVMCAMPDLIWGSITSIGRAITPVWPLFIVFAARWDKPVVRFVEALVVSLGLGVGIFLALHVHPFTML